MEQDSPLSWLIVEDALRDRSGHWFEYLRTFCTGLHNLADKSTLLVDHTAESFVQEELRAHPVLPKSIWHRMDGSAGSLRRYARVPYHAWQTKNCLIPWLDRNSRFDVVFVPTVMVHHLLGWTWLIKRRFTQAKTITLLFFPNTPIRSGTPNAEATWIAAPTARLFCGLIKALKGEVNEGKVILGVETHAMRKALTNLTGVRFTYFPHPAAAINRIATNARSNHEILMSSYGGGRQEKGRDVLLSGVARYCKNFPNTKVRFELQDFGMVPSKLHDLDKVPKVKAIPANLNHAEYSAHLGATQVILLPYRRASYAYRVSRVAIEAMVNGIPAIVTSGTTLEEQTKEFGAAVNCPDGSAEGFFSALTTMETRYDDFQESAESRKLSAQGHFSVLHFREILKSNHTRT